MRKLYRETSIALWEEWIITSLQSYTSSIVIEFASQAASLRQLEEENQEAAARLEEVVYRGDMLLEKIQSALADIAQSQLCTRSGAPSQSTPPESWQRLTPSKHGLYRLYTAGILYWRSCVKCAVWFWFHSKCTLFPIACLVYTTSDVVFNLDNCKCSASISLF